QRLFYGHLRRAQYETAPAGDAGPALAARLQQLRPENARLARAHGFEKLRAEAEKQPRDGAADAGEVLFALPRQRTPRYWVAGAPPGASAAGAGPSRRPPGRGVASPRQVKSVKRPDGSRAVPPAAPRSAAAAASGGNAPRRRRRRNRAR